MIKLINDLLDLKQWVRKTGATAEGKGMYGKIHSEKQILDLIDKYNTEKKKKINILWFNTSVEYLGDSRVLSNAKVIVSNGVEHMELETQGIGEEKRGDIAFGLGKAMTYSKRFFLSKLIGLSSEDIEPEHITNKVVNTPVKVIKASTPTFKVSVGTGEFAPQLAKYKNGKPVIDKNGVQMTVEQHAKAKALAKAKGLMIWDISIGDLK